VPPLESAAGAPARFHAASCRPHGLRTHAPIRRRLVAQCGAGVWNGGEAALESVGGEIAVGWWLVRSVSVYFSAAAPADFCASFFWYAPPRFVRDRDTQMLYALRPLICPSQPRSLQGGYTNAVCPPFAPLARLHQRSLMSPQMPQMPPDPSEASRKFLTVTSTAIVRIQYVLFLCDNRKTLRNESNWLR
jgi:hypothetical protein